MSNDYSISKFFMEDLPSYAAYDGTRKIAQVWDGLKISMRKIIFTLQNKYPKEFVNIIYRIRTHHSYKNVVNSKSVLEELSPLILLRPSWKNRRGGPIMKSQGKPRPPDKRRQG